MSTGKGWIGVDLDGTLAHYDKWRGMDHIGEPIAPMVDHVKQLLADGRDVRIFTARVCSGQEPSEVDKFLRAITHWTFKHIGRQLPVTSEKDWAMIMLYDDRCLSVERNTGKIIPLDALDRIAELEYTVGDLRGKLAQFDPVSPEARNCILGMSLEEATKQIPGGAKINMEEQFVMSLAWDYNGEAMHEHWGEGVTPATAVLKLYERAKRAEEALKG